MLQICGQRTDDVGMKDGRPRYEMNMEMWANISPTNASNQMPCHPGCIWSDVYYVDDGDGPSSKLVLQDPNYAPDLQFVRPNGERFPVQREIEPKPGLMEIFHPGSFMRSNPIKARASAFRSQ